MRDMRTATDPRGQLGIASILLILFVGLALMATVYTVVNVASSAQERTLAVHATTAAQGEVWNTAEAIRRYLDKEEPDTIRAWEGVEPVSLTLSEGGTAIGTVSVVKVENLDPTKNRDYRITAEITGTAGAGSVATTAPLEAVYSVRLAASSSAPGTPMEELNFSDGLDISGNMQVTGAEHANVGVTGDVNIHHTNLTGIEEIRATGSVTVSSAVGLDTVWSNENVELLEGSRSSEVKARGTVLLSGRGLHDKVWSNGTVTLHSSSAEILETRADLVAGVDGQSCQDPPIGNNDGTYVGAANVTGNVWWYSCGGGLKTLQTNGTVRYHGATRNETVNPNIQFLDSQHLRAAGDMDIRSAEHTGRFTTIGNLQHRTRRNASDNCGASPALCAHPAVGTGGPHSHASSDSNPANVHLHGYCVEDTLTWTEPNNHAGHVKGWAGTFVPHPDQNASVVFGIKDLQDDPPPSGECDFGFDDDDVAVDEVPVYTRSAPQVDARLLRDDANLVFEWDPAFGPRVTVKNMAGVNDGVYALGWTVVNHNDRPDYLCDPGDLVNDSRYGQKKCSEPLKSICGHSAAASCFSYTSPSATNPRGTWKVGDPGWNARTMARGVAWFEGDLELGPTSYVNAFIATGNIHVRSSHKNEAPNYAGYAKLCTNAQIYDASGGTEGLDTTELAGLYPTNLCEGGNVSEDRTIGNVSMIAGSFDENDNFIGGNITVEGQARIGGTVMAGNELVTGGNTQINGYLVGAGQGVRTDASGKFTQTTQIDLTPRTGWNPSKHPPMKGNKAKVVWARYR